MNGRSHDAIADLLIVLTLVVFALALRFGQLHDSLWLDELHTAWTVRGSLDEMVSRANMGNNGALYFALPYLTTRLFGWSEWSLRLPSLVAGVATVVALFYLLRRIGAGRIASTVAGLLVAVDSHCLFYSLEARTYALVQLVGLLQVASMVGWIANPNRTRAALYGVLSLLLVYLHMTAGLLLIAQSIVLLLLPLLFARRPVYWWQTLVAIAIGALPLLLLASAVLPHRGAWSFVKIPDAIDLVWVFPIARHCGLAVLCFGSMLLWSRRSDREANDLRPSDLRWLSLVFGCFCLTLLIAWNLTWFDLARLFFRRYLVAVSILPMLFTGLLLNRMKWPWQAIIGAATVGLVVYFGPYRTWSRHGEFALRANEGWRSAIERLSQEQPRLLIVDSGLIECDRLSQDASAAFREYCSLPVRGLYRLTGQDVGCEIVPIRTTNPSVDVAELWESRRGIDRAWIVSRGRKDWPELLTNQNIGFQPVAEYGTVSIVRIFRK